MKWNQRNSFYKVEEKLMKRSFRAIIIRDRLEDTASRLAGFCTAETRAPAINRLAISVLGCRPPASFYGRCLRIMLIDELRYKSAPFLFHSIKKQHSEFSIDQTGLEDKKCSWTDRRLISTAYNWIKLHISMYSLNKYLYSTIVK